MALSSKDQEIADLAGFIALQPGYSSDFHVEPERIAKEKGITFSYNNYGAYFDGLLEHRNGRFHIYCNTYRSDHKDSPRTRFTFAHELGHYFIDEHRRALASGRVPMHSSKANYRSKNPVEREADFFASHLLLPDEWFLPMVHEGKRGMPTILKIADKFKVSLTAAASRYVSSDILPCALVKWSGGTVQWKWTSSPLWRSGFRLDVKNKDSLPKDSPTVKMITGNTPSERDLLEAATSVSVWSSSDHHGNSSLIEQAFSLGRFGGLTLLYQDETDA